MSQADQPNERLNTFEAVVHHLADEYRRKVTVVRPDDVAEALHRNRKRVSRVFSNLAAYGIVEESGDDFVLTEKVVRLSYGLKHPPRINPFTGRPIYWAMPPWLVLTFVWLLFALAVVVVFGAISISVDWPDYLEER